MGVRIDPQTLDGLVEMWVRGIHFCEVGSVIPVGYGVSVLHVDDDTRAKALSKAIGQGKVIQKGPGVEVTIYHAQEADEFAALYVFDMWKTLKCTALVDRAA